MQQKREADEQQKSVAAYGEKISAEEVKCKTMADNAQRDLDEAIPALDEATKVILTATNAFYGGSFYQIAAASNNLLRSPSQKTMSCIV